MVLFRFFGDHLPRHVLIRVINHIRKLNIDEIGSSSFVFAVSKKGFATNTLGLHAEELLLREDPNCAWMFVSAMPCLRFFKYRLASNCSSSILKFDLFNFIKIIDVGDSRSSYSHRDLAKDVPSIFIESSTYSKLKSGFNSFSEIINYSGFKIIENFSKLSSSHQKYLYSCSSKNQYFSEKWYFFPIKHELIVQRGCLPNLKNINLFVGYNDKKTYHHLYDLVARQNDLKIVSIPEHGMKKYKKRLDKVTFDNVSFLFETEWKHAIVNLISYFCSVLKHGISDVATRRRLKSMVLIFNEFAKTGY